MLTKNTNGQPMVSVIRPPMAGPIRLDMPEHGAEQALVPAALRRREQVGDRRHREREDRARAEALDAARGDQLPHLLAQAGQHRAEDEHADAEQEHRPAAEQVGDLAVERAADRRRQQVGRDGPRVEAVAAEVGDDRRQRRADDGLVERGQEDRDHDRAEDAHADGVGELHRRDILRAAPCLCRWAGHRWHLSARSLDVSTLSTD